MAKYRELFNINLGRRIRERRIKMGYSSQEKFAEALGLSRGTVALWETGDNGISDESYATVKKVLKVDDDFFLSRLSDLTQRNVTDHELINRSLMDRIKALESILTPENQELIEAFSSLSPSSKKAILNSIKNSSPQGLSKKRAN